MRGYTKTSFNNQNIKLFDKNLYKLDECKPKPSYLIRKQFYIPKQPNNKWFWLTQVFCFVFDRSSRLDCVFNALKNEWKCRV